MTDGSAVTTAHLDLVPLPAAAARCLPDDRDGAAAVLGAALSPEWPLPDLLAILSRQASARTPEAERFGIWVMVERETATVVGDAGFHGAPAADRSVEIGYAVVPDRRRRGYATEAARALAEWAAGQEGVTSVVATCDEDNLGSVRTLERVGFLRAGGEDGGQLRWRWARTADGERPDDRR